VNAMYLVGPMARNQQAASFAGALGLMTKANIDLETAMGHLIAFTSNPITRQDLIVVKGQIERGLSLSESLSGCKSFPQSLPWFVALGERGDNLTGTLMSTEEFYRTETNNLLGFISTSLEPLLIFTMGIPFGALAVSIFLPMLRLINNVG